MSPIVTLHVCSVHRYTLNAKHRVSVLKIFFGWGVTLTTYSTKLFQILSARNTEY